MHTKILDADRLELRRSDGTRAEVVTRTSAQSAVFELNINPGDWTRADDVYVYRYTGMLIGPHSVLQATPKATRRNALECAKCMIIAEQDGAEMVFTAVNRVPTDPVTFKLRILG